MRTATAFVTVLVGLAVATAVADDQADHIKTCRENPTEDFARLYNDDGQRSWAYADAMAYFQDHGNIDKDLKEDRHLGSKIGLAHALAHHLLGHKARTYSYNFEDALEALASAKEVETK